MKKRRPYPSKHGDPIHKNTEYNNTSINNKKEEEAEIKNTITELIDFYQNNITLITDFVAQDMNGYLQKGLQADLIIEAMKEAVSRNKRNWKYVTGILNNCLDNKISTAHQFEVKQKEFKSNKIQTIKKNKTQEKIEYEEIDFTDDKEYKKKILGKG